MLHGRRLTLFTDRKPLLSIFGSRKGIPNYIANRLQRWATMLLGYDFTIEYKSCRCIIAPNGQSQAWKWSNCYCFYISRRCRQHVAQFNANLSSGSCSNGRSHSPWSNLEATSFIYSTRLASTYNVSWNKAVLSTTQILIHCKRLCYVCWLCCSSNLLSLILQQLHTAHSGTGRMKNIARSYVY